MKPATLAPREEIIIAGHGGQGVLTLGLLLAHAGMQVPGGWMNINLQRLVSNAVAWTSRCP